MDCPHLEPVENGAFFERLKTRMTSQRYPFLGSLEVTFRCNLRCVHCYLGSYRSGIPSMQELTTAEIRNILDQVTDAGCLELLLTGGEPFVRPDLLDIYTYARQKGLMVILFTNATLITPEIARYLADWTPQSVEVTLYGYSQETYERISGIPGSHARCLRGIELLLQQGIPLKLKTMLMTLNQHELAQMKHFAESLGVAFRYDPLLNAGFDDGRGPLPFRLPPAEVVQADLGDPDRRKDLQDFSRRYAGFQPDSQFLYVCGAGLHSFHIDPYGRMGICMMARARSHDLRRNSFKEGWEQFIPQERALPSSGESRCAGCALRANCSQCPGWAQLEHGNSEQVVDYLCQVSHLRSEAFGFNYL
jgi:MoaA/NifB/PqqE/SkfB family radical SAM enzyme